MNIIGEKIRLLRKEKNITQEQLAIELHTAKSTIGMWENGRRVPDLDTIRKIAKFFNKSVEYLTEEYIEIGQVLHDDTIPETKCPICGYEYIKFIKTFPVSFPNEKSSGICLQFQCEAEHEFYLVIENYKGNSYMAYFDENFEQIEFKLCENQGEYTYKLSELEERMLMAFRNLTPEDRLIEIGKAEGIAEKYSPEQKEKAS